MGSSPLVQQNFTQKHRLLHRRFLQTGLAPLCRSTIQRIANYRTFCILSTSPLAVGGFAASVRSTAPLKQLFSVSIVHPSNLGISERRLGLRNHHYLVYNKPTGIYDDHHVRAITRLRRGAARVLARTQSARSVTSTTHLTIHTLLCRIAAAPGPNLISQHGDKDRESVSIFAFVSDTTTLCPCFRTYTQANHRATRRPTPRAFTTLQPLNYRTRNRVLSTANNIGARGNTIFSINVIYTTLKHLSHSL